MTYSEALQYVAQYYQKDASYVEMILNDQGFPPGDAKAVLGLLPDSYELYTSSDGTILGYNSKATSPFTPGGALVAQEINSNAGGTVRNASMTVPMQTQLSTTGKMEFTSGIGYRASTGTTVMGVANTVSAAVGAVGWGIKLGKWIDSTLYNANPDFWDRNGMGSINPDTWGTLTMDYDDDPVRKWAFNTIFEIAPDTEETTPYIDEDVAASVTQWLAQNGAFSSGGGEVSENTTTLDPSPVTLPFNYNPGVSEISWRFHYNTNVYNGKVMASDPVDMAIFISGTSVRCILASTSPFTYGSSSLTTNSTATTYEGQTIYYGELQNSYYYAAELDYITGLYNATSLQTGQINSRIIGIIMEVDGESSSPLEGVTDQPGATLPQITPDMTLDEIKDALQQTYPELWEDAIETETVQPDGTVRRRTFIPTTIPEGVDDPKTDTQPTDETQPQTKPGFDPEDDDDILEKIKELLVPQPDPQPQPDGTAQPADPDPPDTGTGETPPAISPTGSASSLWAVYNPTQAQLNSFGAWLWSSDFVEQIKKLFSDPMQAIIGISKVYATPITGAAQNIKVGYLDSGVSSAVVTNQYTTIDCGTVRLAEYFGNVFDYAPFTQVSLFLPFIGIVELDVAEVMRASINVTYHVDVISGACLAEVSVIRDSAGGVLYTYSGNAAVQYPFSAGSYASMVAGTLSIAAGIAGTVISGGAMAPALLGAAGAVGRLHTNVQHSGSFSGNAGAMGGKIPYLIIKRPQTKTAVTFPGIDGYPTNYSTTVGSCTGYIKCENCHVDGIPATFEELEQIESMLKDGVIV